MTALNSPDIPPTTSAFPQALVPENSAEWDVRKQVWVPAGPKAAFDVFVNHPTEWYPSHHALVADRDRIVFEPEAGGRWYERSTSGEVRDWGRVLRFEPGRSLALTWRVDGRWRSVDNDDIASRIEVTFSPAEEGGTDVELAHVELWRHGADATAIHAAIAGDSPGDTLALFERAVRRHHPDADDPTAAADLGTTTANKRVVLASFDALAGGRLDLPTAARLHTPEYLDHQARDARRGPRAAVSHGLWLRGVFPDLAFDIQDVIAENDKVVLRSIFTGTHLGDLYGVAPTGNQVRTEQIHILRLDCGRIAEHWAARDHSKLAEQLGK